MFFLKKPSSEHHRKKCRSRLKGTRIWSDHFGYDIHLREVDPDMEYEHEGKSSILRLDILPEGFSMLMDIPDTHGKHDRIHEKCPEPDGTRGYPHTVKSHCKAIKTESDEKHPSTRISIECLDRIRKSDMRFLYREIIRPSECEEYPEKTVNIYPFVEEKDTRKNRRERDESLHRSDERNISECEWLKVKVLSEIIKQSSEEYDPKKRRLDMIWNPFSYEHWTSNQEEDKRCYPRHHSCIEWFEWLLRRNILKGIEEGEDEEGVEVDQGRKEWK
jgi:hypothetical protein